MDEPYGDRISSMTEDLGLVWLHVVSPPGIEEDLELGLGELGRLRRLAVAAAAATARRTTSRTNTRANLAGGRRARFEEWVDQDQARAAAALNFKHTLHAARAVAVHARRRAATGASQTTWSPACRTRPTTIRASWTCCSSATSCRRASPTCSLQELWRHLKREGLWDESLIVVAADHGVAFIKGRRDRRRLDAENYGEIAPIPLFIKAPGQREGRVNDAYVETIDILPTILDILKIDPKVKMDGHSAFSDTVKRRRTLRILQRNSFEPLRFSTEEFERRKAVVRARNHALFGSGSDGPLRMFQIGPHQELLGRRVEEGGGKGSVEIFDSSDWANVNPDSDFVPTHPVGRIDDDGSGPRDIAVALNGRIAAVGNTFSLAEGEPGELFSVMVPESALQRGRNRIDVFEVAADGSLERLGGIWRTDRLPSTLG